MALQELKVLTHLDVRYSCFANHSTHERLAQVLNSFCVAVGAWVPWIDYGWFKIYQLQQSTTIVGFDPGMCRSDAISTIVRLSNIS